ncbi:TIR domain-containing protein [Kribbella orskensis]|uniref:TIR domain-containing protein n=1 Tax=Kribbella orskensis TaxID=2512216 RepID=A0ABY2BRA7_9ACTN|nr:MULTISPECIES: DUF1883 domain-containing protein [Kribbella]TCN28163.1 TIR domain-containing protein [Kribbella sp. VKM Ac-2500]TCO27959.1 TIR domain-containing protein [Kribbella orskensis]
MSSGFPFTKYEFPSLKRGATVEVTLQGNGANVRLMDSSNFNAYKAGRAHRYVGGLIQRSPYRMSVPRDGRWFVTVDMIGLRGTTRSSVRIIPPPLAPARQGLSGGSLSDIRHEAPPSVEDDAQVWDVFVSHASEDKAAVARPLTDALKQLDVSVWLDDFELRIGDSLRRKIDRGLARSRFGVVIISRSFFAKGWPQYELDGIVSRSVSGQQTLLPVWHEITKAEVMDQSPSLVDKIARSTSQYTIDEIAREIAEVIHSNGEPGIDE